MKYTVSPMLSHYFTNQHMAVTSQEKLQCASTEREEDCKQINMDVKLDLNYFKNQFCKCGRKYTSHNAIWFVSLTAAETNALEKNS